MGSALIAQQWVTLGHDLVPSRAPRLLPLRGQWWVRNGNEHHKRTIRMTLRGYRPAGRGMAVDGAAAESSLCVAFYPHVWMDLCALWRRLLLSGGWLTDRWDGLPAAADQPLAWALRIGRADASGTGFDASGSVEMVGTLGRSDTPRREWEGALPAEGMWQTNRPGPVRYVPDRTVLLTQYYGCEPQAPHDAREVRLCHWDTTQWRTLAKRYGHEADLRLPYPASGTADALPPVPLTLRVGPDRLRVRSPYGEGAWHLANGAMQYATLTHGSGVGAHSSHVMLSEYVPSGPRERMLMLYWVNARGGWETSVIEWARWEGSQEGADGPGIWDGPRTPYQKPNAPGWQAAGGAGLKARVKGRIYAPGPQERHWLGELWGSPITYLSGQEGVYLRARVAGGEAQLSGHDGVWVDVELQAGEANGRAPASYG